MRVHVLIAAAGMGRRMGAAVNKQYLLLAGRPLLAHSVALFASHPRVAQVVVVVPADEIPYCRASVIEPAGWFRPPQLVAGGAERQDSVRNGLAALAAADDDCVIIHDGARPLFPAAKIAEVVAAVESTGACVVAVPVKDTIKEVAAGRVVGTPERSRLWAAQTPQAFRFGLIAEAHRRAVAEGFHGTDDAMLVERLGHPVAVVEGSYRNLKITTPEDLTLAEAWLRQEAP